MTSKPLIRFELGKTNHDTRIFVDDRDISSCIQRMVFEYTATEAPKVWLKLSPFSSIVRIAEGIEAIKAYIGPIPKDLPKEIQDEPVVNTVE